MRRRFLWVPFLSICILFTVVGCASVSKAIDNYEACKGDSVCMSEMSKVKESSYVVAKAASSGFPIPSVPEVIAVVISNILSFGYGVFHGGKKKA